MRKQFLLPLLAAAGGVMGGLLRGWQLETSFEQDTGLPLSGTSATLTISLAFVFFAILVLLASRVNRPKQPLGFPLAFRNESPFYLIPVLIAAALTAAGGLLYLMDWSRTYDPPALQLLFGLIAMVGAACLLLVGLRNYKQGWTSEKSPVLLGPAFMSCVWLMFAYQGWARDPIVIDYVFDLFAIIFTLLAHYYVSSYAFGRPRETPLCITATLALAFSLTIIPFCSRLADQLLFAGVVLYLLPTLYTLCRNNGQEQLFPNPNSPNPENPLKEDSI